MVERADRADPERGARYRAAVRAAERNGINLTAWWTSGQWRVSAYQRGDGAGPVVMTGRTAGDAAWHALAALKKRAASG